MLRFSRVAIPCLQNFLKPDKLCEEFLAEKTGSSGKKTVRTLEPDIFSLKKKRLFDGRVFCLNEGCV